MLMQKAVNRHPNKNNFIQIINKPYCDHCKTPKPDDPVEAVAWYHETRKVQGVESSYDVCPKCQNSKQQGMARFLGKIKLRNIQADINQLRQEHREIETRIARKELKYQMARRVLEGFERLT